MAKRLDWQKPISIKDRRGSDVTARSQLAPLQAHRRGWRIAFPHVGTGVTLAAYEEILGLDRAQGTITCDGSQATVGVGGRHLVGECR